MIGLAKQPGGAHLAGTVSRKRRFMILDALLDAVIDTLKLVPFLFVTYLFMEYMEHKTSARTTAWLEKAGHFGPVLGGGFGILPQCGFSAAAASLFSGGVISIGTLIAVFLSTSDEMLPIFISEQVAPLTILKILGTKAILGVISGYLLDFFMHHGSYHTYAPEKHIHDLCDHEQCECEHDEKNAESHEENEPQAEHAEHHHGHAGHGHSDIFRPALHHTLQITVFIFLITLVITLLVEGIGAEALGNFLSGKPVIGVFLAGIVGLIPNCAASVSITQLYLMGILNAGQMMAGLLVGAGVGLLVLFRTNDHPNENLRIAIILYAIGVFWGLLIEHFQIVF